MQKKIKYIIFSLLMIIVTIVLFQELIIPKTILFCTKSIQNSRAGFGNIIFLVYPIMGYIFTANFVRSIVNVFSFPILRDIPEKLVTFTPMVLGGVLLGPWATVIFGIIAGIYIGLNKD